MDERTDTRPLFKRLNGVLCGESRRRAHGTCARAALQASYRPGAARRYAPHAADGSSTRGGSTSVRGQVRSPHMPKLQAASVPIPRAAERLGLGQRDGQTDGSRYRLMPPPLRRGG